MPATPPADTAARAEALVRRAQAEAGLREGELRTHHAAVGASNLAADLSRRGLRPGDRRAGTPLAQRLGRVNVRVGNDACPPCCTFLALQARSLVLRGAMDNARDLERYSSIGADIRQVESVIAELERHHRVLSTHVRELRHLLTTMQAVTRLVLQSRRAAPTSTIGGGGQHQLAVADPLTRGRIAPHLRRGKAAQTRRRPEHASA